jgi:hypothetical protein
MVAVMYYFSAAIFSTIIIVFAQEFSTPYSIHYGKALDFGPFRIMLGLSLDDCRKECQGRLRCLSFNFKATICELNQERQNANKPLKDRPGSVYQEKPSGPQSVSDECYVIFHHNKMPGNHHC